MPDFNVQQQLAVDHNCTDGALLVSAAAGSGKTTVMVGRVVRILSDPAQNVRADRLFVSTFTVAAATELRNKLAKELDQKLKEARENGQQERERWLSRQRVYLQRAAIGTVDAYCQQLLHRYFALLELPPDFAVADDVQLAQLENQALATVVGKALQENQDYRNFADLYGRSRDVSKASQQVLALFRFVQNLPEPERQLERFASVWKTEGHVADTLWGVPLVRHARVCVQACIRALRQQQERLNRTEDPGLLALASLFADDAELMRPVLRALERCEQHCCRENWQAVPVFEGKKRWLSYKNKDNAEGMALADAAKAARPEIWKKANDAMELFERFGLVEREAAPAVQALVDTTLAFGRELWQLKLQEKKFGFADLEQLAVRLLWQDGQRTRLSFELAQGFAAVMVDEYQDTNELQDTLYRCIANPEGSNLFFVGDIKQSIYRFRRADPGIFKQKLETYQPFDGKTNVPQVLALSCNYRSSRNVVEGCNSIFAKLMTRTLGDVDYDTPMQRLTVGSPDTEDGECRVVFLERPENCDEDAEQAQKAAKRSCEAIWTAQCIRKMLNEKIQIRTKDGSRPAHPEDFCILMRSRSAFPQYLAALDSQGIPAFADTAEDLLSTEAVRPVADLLRVLDNPSQDVAFTGVVLSPMFGFTLDDLLCLRGVRPVGSLYSALLAALKKDNLPPQQKRKYIHFYEELNRLSRLACTAPVELLLEEIMASTGYPAVLSAKPDGESAQNELQSFLAWAAQKGESGLHSVIRAMDAVEESGSSLPGGTGVPKRPGCATIMTVHHSKGLEFPVVFVCDMAHRFNMKEEMQPVLIDPHLGVGVRCRMSDGKIHPTAAHQAIRYTMAAEMASEELRLLYVALTRAQSRLILPLTLPETEKEREALERYGLEYQAENAKSWQQWLLLTLTEMEKTGGVPKAIRVEHQPLPLPEELETGKLPFAQRVEQLLPQENTALAARLEQIWQQWEQGRQQRNLLQRVPVKTSVSAIAHKAYTDRLSRPAFARRGRAATGAERGTMTHAFLQMARFTLPFSMEEELARLIAAKQLTPEDAELLDQTALQTFFSSDSFAYICSAKEIRKEYPFITQVPARTVMPDKLADYGDAASLVQGVVDLLLIFEDHGEIWDYKTDQGKTAEQLAETYRAQLWLYRFAMERRLKVPITRCVIYSLALGQEIEVALL